MAGDPTSERFKAVVRAINEPSRTGDHRQALARLSELLEIEPDDSRYSRKKAHFIAALAYRAVQTGEKGLALDLLSVADRSLPDEHMIPFLREERAFIRKAAEASPGRD